MNFYTIIPKKNHTWSTLVLVTFFITHAWITSDWLLRCIELLIVMMSYQERYIEVYVYVRKIFSFAKIFSFLFIVKLITISFMNFTLNLIHVLFALTEDLFLNCNYLRKKQCRLTVTQNVPKIPTFNLVVLPINVSSMLYCDQNEWVTYILASQ